MIFIGILACIGFVTLVSLTTVALSEWRHNRKLHSAWERKLRESDPYTAGYKDGYARGVKDGPRCRTGV